MPILSFCVTLVRQKMTTADKEPSKSSTTSRLKEIKRSLAQNATAHTGESAAKFVPTAEKVYGVKVGVLNELAREHKEGSFELIEMLWASGAFEERLLATKILGLNAKKDPARTLSLAAKFFGQVNDWAVCDTLATQGIRPLLNTQQAEILELSDKLLAAKSLWQRRAGIVLLTNFAKDKALHPRIRKTIKNLRSDKEHYVRKALDWLERDL
jgi:3-methyladenine DNA glycosylase AlkD